MFNKQMDSKDSKKMISCQKVFETEWFSLEAVSYDSLKKEPYYRLSSNDSVTIPSLTVGGTSKVMVAQVAETGAAGAAGAFGLSTTASVAIGAVAAVAVGVGVAVAATTGGGEDHAPVCP